MACENEQAAVDQLTSDLGTANALEQALQSALSDVMTAIGTITQQLQDAQAALDDCEMNQGGMMAAAPSDETVVQLGRSEADESLMHRTEALCREVRARYGSDTRNAAGDERRE